MARRRRGQLSDEDRRLWSQVAATAEPLAGRRVRTDAGDIPEAAGAGPASRGAAAAPGAASRPPQPAVPPPVPLPGFRIGQNAPPVARPSAYHPAPTAAERLAAHPPAMDHKTHRRMVRGRLAPEARIDLHGMTLATAQPVLERFVLTHHAARRRLVLVITGKGKPGGPDAPLPVRPGALRHYVPIWLTRPPLSGAVLQVTPAHQRHGGEGAYYVYLRR